MEKSSCIDLKEEILDSYFKESLNRPSIGVQSIEIERPERRLAVGYSQKKKGDFVLEIRIQREGAFAHKEAHKFKEKAKGEANIGIVPQIAVPSFNSFFSRRKSRKPIKFNKSKDGLSIGASIGHIDSGPGSLGAFVETMSGVALLSNSHVIALAGRATVKEDFVYHPGKPDKKPLTYADRVASLSNFVEISRKDANDADCAIADLLDSVVHTGNKIPKGCGSKDVGKSVSKVMEYDELQPFQKLSKIGRSTGYTEGTLNAVSVDEITVYFPGLGNVRFDNLLEIRSDSVDNPFTRNGDSGSMVFSPSGLSAVGLHFAGGKLDMENGQQTYVSYACSMQTVLDGLGVSLL